MNSMTAQPKTDGLTITAETRNGAMEVCIVFDGKNGTVKSDMAIDLCSAIACALTVFVEQLAGDVAATGRMSREEFISKYIIASMRTPQTAKTFKREPHL